MQHTVTVDGVVDAALTEPNGIDLTSDGAPAVIGWEGEQDLSGTLWLTHDADNLYVTASMVDDAHANPGTGSDIWRGDGIQVGVTAGAPGETLRVQEIGFALGGAGEVDTYRWAPSDQSTDPTGMQASVVRDEDAKTTVYEASIPWTTLGIDPAARLLSTTVVVNENDGSGRAGWLTWGAGLAESKNPSLYRSLLLSAVVPQEPVDTLDLRLNARSQCWPSGATVAVHAVNQGDLNTDIRIHVDLRTTEVVRRDAGRCRLRRLRVRRAVDRGGHGHRRRIPVAPRRPRVRAPRAAVRGGVVRMTQGHPGREAVP